MLCMRARWQSGLLFGTVFLLLSVGQTANAVTPTITEGQNGWYTRLEISYPGCPSGGWWFTGPYIPPEGRHRLRMFKDGQSLLVHVDDGAPMIVATCAPPPAAGWEEYAKDYALERAVSLAITSPDTRESMAARLTIAGTYGVASGSDATITVNGVTASKSQPGLWKAEIPLTLGTNTVNVSLRSTAGNSASATIVVEKKASVSPAAAGSSGEGEENAVAKNKPKGRATVRGASKDLPARVNEAFRRVHRRNPTPAERRYWLGRVTAGHKKTFAALVGAIQHHRNAGIRH